MVSNEILACKNGSLDSAKDKNLTKLLQNRKTFHLIIIAYGQLYLKNNKKL